MSHKERLLGFVPTLPMQQLHTITQSWQCWYYGQLSIPINFPFFSLFATNDVSKYEIRNWIHEDYILGSHVFLDELTLNVRKKLYFDPFS